MLTLELSVGTYAVHNTASIIVSRQSLVVIANIWMLLPSQAQVRVRRIPENISGVATVSLQAIEESGISDSLRYAGLGAGGHRTGEAKKAFREAVRILIKFASLRNTCILLDTAIRSTLR